MLRRTGPGAPTLALAAAVASAVGGQRFVGARTPGRMARPPRYRFADSAQQVVGGFLLALT